MFGMTAPLCGHPPSRTVEQNMAHDLRRHSEEMGSVLPVHVSDIDELEIGLMDEGSGLESLARTLILQMARSDAAQGVVDVRRQTLQCALITIGPRTKQQRRFRSLIVFWTRLEPIGHESASRSYAWQRSQKARKCLVATLSAS